jgi:uncharacterized peroxidase-related enzyme
MSLIELVDPESNPELRELYESTRYDGESPFRQAMLHNPDVLRARSEYTQRLLESGPIDQELYEYVMVVVAQTNDCEYCAGSHRLKLMAMADADEDVVDTVANREYESLPGRTRAVVEFAEQVADDPHRVTEADLAPLYDAGFDEAGIVQLLAVISDCNTSNSIVSALGITPDHRSDDLPVY